MTGSPKITSAQVAHIAKLAHIPVTEEEKEKLATAFTETLAVVDQLQEVDTADVPTTHQVTGLENVTREDAVDERLMFTQEEALANATRKHNGYFVVPQVIEKD
ncbi:MAG TPA: Asp-tRNA(Asn)/Glu-tRNA(Gln) amidotransferase subunit GatC [Patescibacteria group bacterium]